MRIDVQPHADLARAQPGRVAPPGAVQRGRACSDGLRVDTTANGFIQILVKTLAGSRGSAGFFIL